VKHLFVNVSLSDNLLSPRPGFLKRAPYTCEPLRCKTHDPEQVEALHRVSDSVWAGVRPSSRYTGSFSFLRSIPNKIRNELTAQLGPS
jgi:hypothetical protein